MAWQPDYADSGQLSEYVRIGDDQDDAQVALAVTAASRAVDNTTHRQFGINDQPVDRFYSSTFDRDRERWLVDIDDITDDGDLEVSVDTTGDGEYDTDVDEFRLLPVNAAADGMPWTQLSIPRSSSVRVTGGPHDVRVRALFGWKNVPDPIVQATLLQASRFLQRRDAPFGVAGSPDQGSEMRLLAKVDADVEVTLAKYVRFQQGFA